jgi:hypothetical protein
MDSRMNVIGLIPDALRRAWQTDWDSLDLAATEKRLQRLYDLRQFAELCGAEIPNSWRRFLADEIDRGESRQAKLVFAKESTAEQVSAERERQTVPYVVSDEGLAKLRRSENPRSARSAND